MINLLPPEIKQSYRYALRNHRSIHWIGALFLCFLGVAAITIAGIIYMNHSIDNYNRQIATVNDKLKAQDITGVQKQVKDTSNNLKLAVNVLSKEILFSKLLTQLAKVTPSNVILTDLSITNTVGSIGITAETSNYAAATQLQVNLADPANKIFSKADIVSIACTNSSTSKQYPCTVSLQALFASDNPFLFINSGQKAN